MMIKDRVIGVINSYTQREYKFSKEEVDILQAIANQAAVAIENTRLDQESLPPRTRWKRGSSWNGRRVCS
jgi:GAF domain-containing protein